MALSHFMFCLKNIDKKNKQKKLDILNSTSGWEIVHEIGNSCSQL